MLSSDQHAGPASFGVAELVQMASDRLAQGGTISDLAREIGVRPGTLRQKLGRVGYRAKKPRKRDPEFDRDVAMAWQESGKVLIGTMKIAGGSFGRVKRSLIKQGLAVASDFPANRTRARTKIPHTLPPDANGYISVTLPPDHWLVPMAMGANRRVLQHRMVMAEYLGRPLFRGETVHHINGNRSDNRIENLQLRTSNHGPGAAFVCRCCGSVDIIPAPIKEI